MAAIVLNNVLFFTTLASFQSVALGIQVEVVRVDLGDGAIVPVCTAGRHRQRIPILDSLLPDPPPDAAKWIDACRHRRGRFWGQRPRLARSHDEPTEQVGPPALSCFADLEYAPSMALKPQDLLVALELWVGRDQAWTYPLLGSACRRLTAL